MSIGHHCFVKKNEKRNLVAKFDRLLKVINSSFIQHILSTTKKNGFVSTYFEYSKTIKLLKQKHNVDIGRIDETKKVTVEE